MSKVEKMKKITPLFILAGIFISILIFVILFGGIYYVVKHRDNGRADKIYNVIWKCNNPIIEFSVPNEAEAIKKEYTYDGILYNGDELLLVECHWRRPQRKLSIIFKGRDEGLTESIAIEGSYRYFTGNDVIITVTTDNVFQNKYETITLTYYEVD